jgi:hypothetical protein
VGLAGEEVSDEREVETVDEVNSLHLEERVFGQISGYQHEDHASD